MKSQTIRKVLFLGTGSQTPLPDRMNSSVVMTSSCGKNFLFDCGEGIQIQLMKSSTKMSNISHIFITHLHGDHFYGIFGLIQTLFRTSVQKDLILVGPKGIQKVIKSVLSSTYNYKNVNQIIQHQNLNIIYEEIPHNATSHTIHIGSYEVSAYPLKHSNPTFGYVIKEQSLPGRLNIDKAIEMGLNKIDKRYNLLRQGIEVVTEKGILVRPEDIYGEEIKGFKIAFIQDTHDSEKIVNCASNCELLIHECTFPADMKKRAKETLHSTSTMAGQFARRIGAKKMILTHFSGRLNNPSDFEKLCEEAKVECIGTEVEVAEDMVAYERTRNGFERIKN